MTDAREIAAMVRRWAEAATSRSLHGMSQYARANGLSIPQLSLLMHLDRGSPCEVKDVGRHFGFSTSAASQMVDRMVQAGLLVRTEDPADRRARQVRLSAAGRALVEKGRRERDRWVDDLVGALPAARRAAVIAPLSSLIEAEENLRLKERPPAPPAIRTPKLRP